MSKSNLNSKENSEELYQSTTNFLNYKSKDNAESLVNSMNNYIWSFSKLKHLYTSQILFLESIVQPFVETDAIKLGNMVHNYIQGLPGVGVCRTISGGSAKAKDEIALIESDCNYALTPAKFAEYDNVVKAIGKNPQIVSLMEDDTKEVEKKYISCMGEINIGGFIDIETEDCCYEIKTLNSLDVDKIQRACIERSYDLQACIYQFLSSKSFKYIFCETTFPFRTMVINPTPVYMYHGRMTWDCVSDEFFQIQDYIMDLDVKNYTTEKDMTSLGLNSWDLRKLNLKKELGE